MFHTDIKELKERINRAGQKGNPFLFAVDYELDEGLFIENPLEQDDILFQFNGEGNKKVIEFEHTEPKLHPHPIDYKEYTRKFESIIHEITEGKIDLANLTVRTPIESSLSMKEIFQLSQSPFQLYVPEKFVCFSPERFVKIEDGTITSFPMKGTIDASLPDAEYDVLANPKELAEHISTVKLIGDELRLIASDVQVVRFRYIDRIVSRDRELLQVSSEISGKLEENYLSHLGDLIFRLLPGGSIVGMPKARAVEALKIAEGEKRGYYCGISGYFDGKTLDTCVMIRFIEKEGNQHYFRSGGGITIDSECEKEYQEVLNKIYLPFV